MSGHKPDEDAIIPAPESTGFKWWTSCSHCPAILASNDKKTWKVLGYGCKMGH